jgi:putative hydrolase of the HAD superfamily
MHALTRIAPEIKAVIFDAVGTLIHPTPAAGVAYAEHGQQFGSRLETAEIVRRFTVAFREEELRDQANDHRTDEEREIARWRTIVTTVLDDVEDQEGCFASLYAHFRQPKAWSVTASAAAVLRGLSDVGLITGMASNFDRRLREVVAGLPELSRLNHLVISSEVQWKKPSANFFAAVCAQVQLPPEQVLYVGDDYDNDFVGASKAGLPVLLLDGERKTPIKAAQRLNFLADLLDERE